MGRITETHVAVAIVTINQSINSVFNKSWYMQLVQ